MKNANSRFVRVLAIVLVVLMVVPAALVGCGSNKATNDAISEALAAAEAAKQEAEAAKQAAAEAAKKDEEEKAALQEAIDKALAAAEAAKKELEALKGTTVPGVTTSPVSQDDKIVADYAFQMLKEDSELAKIFASFYFEFDAAGDPVGPNTKVYAQDDLDEMADLFAKVKLTIQRATTVDYINTLVANFKADLDAVPTYAERVKALYAAIDFESDFDVVDVVKAAMFLANAHEDVIEELEEEELATKIFTEFYRYTGLDDEIAEYIDKELVTAEDVLYKALFDGANAVRTAVLTLLGGIDDADGKLSVKNIEYASNMNEKLEAADLAFETWEEIFDDSDAVDAAAIDYLADFRKAFVGMPFIFEEGDHLWETYLAAGERVAQLEAAAEAYADLAGDYYDDLSAIGTEEFDYADSVELLADAKAAFDAWMAEYDFDDEDPNVDKIVAAAEGDVMAVYEAKSPIVAYFTYLKGEIEKVNADAFLAAFEQVEADRKIDSFDFAKYGEAVKKALDWYDSFEDIEPEGDFASLGDGFKVAALLANDFYKQTLADFIEDHFTDDYAELFTTMNTVYTNLADAKVEADAINAVIYALAKKTALTTGDYNTFGEIIGANYAQYVADKDADNLGGEIATWYETYAETYNNMEFDDVNFKAMIDWEALDSVYNSYESVIIDAKEEAREIALLYIAWKGTPTTVKKVAGITYDGNFYAGLEKIDINVYSYDFIKEIIPFNVSSFVDENGKAFEVDLAVDEKTVINLSANTIGKWKNDMVNAFYKEMKAVSDEVADGDNALFKGVPVYGVEAAVNFVGNEYKKTQIGNFEAVVAAYCKNTLKVSDAANYKTFNNYEKLVTDVVKFLKDNGYDYSGSLRYGTDKLTYYWPAVYNCIPGCVTLADVPDTTTTTNTTDTTKKYISLDTTKLKKDIEAAIRTSYTKWYADYIKDKDQFANIQNGIAADVEQITTLVLNKGLWTISGEFTLDGDTYTYASNFTGSAYEFIVKKADGDVCENGDLKKQTLETGKYVVPKLTFTVANGVITIAPNFDARTGTVTDEQVKKLIGFGAEEYKSTTLAEIVESLTVKHDIRDAVDAIAANFAKIDNVKKQNNTTDKYVVLSAENLNKLFAAEASNKYYAIRNELLNIMFDDAYITANAGKAQVGSYISADLMNTLSDDAKLAVNTIAHIYYYGEDPEIYGEGAMKGFKDFADTTPVEDMKDFFAEYKNKINNALADYGVEFVVNEDGTEITVPSVVPPVVEE